MIQGELKEHYFTKGYAHLRGVIKPQECQRLILRMREIVAHKSPRDHSKIFDAVHQRTASDFLLQSAHKIACFFDRHAQEDEIARKSPWKALNKVGHALHEQCPVYAQFSQQQAFFQLMREIGQKKPRLIQSMFIFKQPKFGDAVPAHQDGTFIYTEPMTVTGLWFALEDATVDNGCLWVLPGGHCGPLKERFIYKDGEPNFIEKKPINWPRKSFIPLEAQAGDMIILHGKLPHLSEQNRACVTRYAYTLHFIDDSSFFPKNNWLRS